MTDTTSKSTFGALKLLEKWQKPLKMDGCNTSFLLGWPIFRGYVSFGEGNA